MGLFASVTSKLRGQSSLEIRNERERQERITHFRKLVDYYAFDRDAILLSLQNAMRPTFKPTTIDKMQYPLLNVTQKVINRLAVAYLAPAERYVIVPEARMVEDTEETSIVDVLAQKDNILYQRVLALSNIHSAAKQWNRMAKLCDTVYVGVVWRDGKIEYEVLDPSMLDIKESEKNYLEAEEVSFERQFGDEVYSVIWTKDEHRIVDDNGKMVEGLNPWAGVNRYGVIPYIPCRLKMVNDHWGEGDSELVYMNEKINILLASLAFNNIMQSHGQPVAINMNFDGPLKTGPDVVIEANDVGKDDVMPSFEFKSPSPATEETIKLIDWMVKQTAVMKGLSAQSMNTEISDRQSGIAKDIDLAELRERRRDDIEFLRPFEKRLFDITRVVWNFNNTERISEKAVFGIDFQEPELPVSPMDEIIIKEKKMAMGLWSPVLDYMDEDEGIDENQAFRDILRNKKWNQQIMKVDGDTA